MLTLCGFDHEHKLNGSNYLTIWEARLDPVIWCLSGLAILPVVRCPIGLKCTTELPEADSFLIKVTYGLQTQSAVYKTRISFLKMNLRKYVKDDAYKSLNMMLNIKHTLRYADFGC